MKEQSERITRPKPWKIGVIAIAALLGLMFAWHLYLTTKLDDQVNATASDETGQAASESIKVNPVTNLVTITIEKPPELDDEENPFAGLGAAMGQLAMTAIAPMVERELNIQAKERFDLFAMLIPYTVRMNLVEPSAESIAEARRQRDERRAEEAAARAEAAAERERQREAEATAKAQAEAEQQKVIQEYISTAMSLEEVRAAEGERFGQSVDAVFGTVVNNGTKTLSRVRVRFYFLDETGQRIGEKEYSPVFVSAYSMGDNTPLRPGYRKDFGYNIEEHAPKGWANQIEAEIVGLEFLEE